MVDVSEKAPSKRRAVARCRVVTQSELPSPALLRELMHEARLAGIQAAKRTSELIPLCHPIRLSDVAVSVEHARGEIAIEACTEIFERTGVEMEALVACALAGASLLGGLEACGLDAALEDLVLIEKTGGASGVWRRDQALVSDRNERP